MLKIQIILATLLFSHHSQARFCAAEPLGGFEDFDQLVEAKFSAQKSCLHSMAHAPTTPPSSRLPFQTMGSNEVFAINCYLGPADYQKHDRYMFVTDEYIKKYEDHLRSIGQISAINLQYSSDEEVSEIMSCLSKKQQNAVKEYMGGKFRGTIPAYSTIVNDHNLFSNLPEAIILSSHHSEDNHGSLSCQKFCFGRYYRDTSLFQVNV
jgi:hypothetical protein